MGIFRSIRNDLRQRLTAVVEGVEQRNVAAVYESAIAAAEAKAAEFRERLAGLVVMRDRASEELQALQAEQQRVVHSVQEAVRDGDDDTALVLIARRDDLTREVEAKAQLLDELTARVEEAKGELAELRAGVPKLRREKEEKVAQQALAATQIEVQEATSGLSDQAHVRGLASVREDIGRLERQADPGYLDAEGNSVRGRAEAMGRRAAEQSARAQLEAMKRQRAGSNDEGDDE